MPHQMPERSSPSRVRFAAPKAGAPLTAAGRSAGGTITTGGSGGKTITPSRVQRHHDSPAIHRPVLAYPGDCHREVFLLMGHTVCFEAGRFTQTQSSATARCCSRKWMSGPADAWAQFVTDRPRQIEGQFDGLATALQETLPSAGRVLFSLDKPLSWMSPV